MGPIDAERLRWHGIFASSDPEARFRRAHLASDRHSLSILLGLVAVAIASFVPNDFAYAGDARTLSLTLATRGAMVVNAFVAALAIRRAPSPRAFDRIVLVWGLLHVGGYLATNALRPASFGAHAVTDVLSVVLFYAALNAPLALQAVLAFALSAGVMGIFVFVKSGTGIPLVTISSSLVIANGIGVIAAREVHVWKRRQMIEVEKESARRIELEAALAEVRTLRGILPICSHCKRIRDDAGYWQRVEVYLKRNTEADFSHGLCPECLRTHYPAD